MGGSLSVFVFSIACLVAMIEIRIRFADHHQRSCFKIITSLFIFPRATNAYAHLRTYICIYTHAN